MCVCMYVCVHVRMNAWALVPNDLRYYAGKTIDIK